MVLTTLAAGVLLTAILVGAVLPFRAEERALFRQKLIDRDAAVLFPVALQQLAEGEAAAGRTPIRPEELLVPVLLRSAAREGMIGVAIFDAEGNRLQSAPASLLLADLPAGDYPTLLAGQTVSRYTEDFPLDRYFSGTTGREGTRALPILEVLLPLHGRDPARILGFIQYYIDARPLALELALVDHRFNRETAVTVALGAGLIGLVLFGAAAVIRRSQALIAERNESLARANFELGLAAKASALGQITSHLIHGLQGSVAGLRSVIAHRASAKAPMDSLDLGDWKSAESYTARIEEMVRETVALLADMEGQISYSISGREIAAVIRRRNLPAAADRGVLLEVSGEFDEAIDSHRGSMLCLIATNLIQNAISATPQGRKVGVILENQNGAVTVLVSDEGSGISESMRRTLFLPGRSGRPGGTGLGLALSRLLARQIGATLALVESEPGSTKFRLVVPL